MFRKFILLGLFLTLCVMSLGAYLRITGSAIGCPQWPGCMGSLVVDGVPQTLDLAGQPPSAEPGAVSRWATAHRHLAESLGLVLLGLALFGFRARQNRLQAVALALAALTLVALQAALGLGWIPALSRPLSIALHLFTGLAVLGLLYWMLLGQGNRSEASPPRQSGLIWLARLGWAVLVIDLALGGWTSSEGAGLACPDFPTCLGSYNPPLDYAGALHALVPGEASALSFSAKAAIHWAHRLGSVAAFLILSLLAMNVSSNRHTARISKAGVLLSFLLLAQISLGAAAVIMRLPVAIALAHSLVAALLALNVLHILYFLRAPAVGEPASVIAAPPPLVVPQPEAPPPAAENLFERLRSGLGKTRTGLTGFLGNLALGKKAIDRDLLDDIEAQLLMADLGVTATGEIIRDLTDSLERSQLSDVGVLTARLRDHLFEILEPCSQPLSIPAETKPFVILVVGVNGVGKTTTIGKLARHLQNQGRSVMLAAGDTFRAAAVEQLQTWGERNQIPVIAQHTGADSASVIYDGVQAAQSRGIDVLIADTAGRLHTKSNLMEELSKIKRIMGKLDPSAPHEVLLVLDAGTGQNAINQAKQFNEAVGLTGLVLTKLDGTAKGGVIFALAKQFGIPIRYIGVGEGINDLQDFDARQFIDALFAAG